jgi:hypothetical protein
MMRWLVSVVVVLGSGCLSRVSLVVPALEAPREERVDAWVALRPVETAVTTYSSAQHPDLIAATDLDSLTLGNGLVVADPRDLLPVVLAGSETARAVADWDRETRRWNVHGWVALGLLGVGGLALGVLPMLGKTDGERAAFAGGAAGFILISELVNLVAALALGEQPQVSKLRAFRAYRADLRERLGNP